jgi:hypothetical protein
VVAVSDILRWKLYSITLTAYMYTAICLSLALISSMQKSLLVVMVD